MIVSPSLHIPTRSFCSTIRMIYFDTVAARATDAAAWLNPILPGSLRPIRNWLRWPASYITKTATPGTGELEAVAMLSGLMGRMGAKPTIKCSRDLTPDDLNQHNVILLGSPFQNVAVAQLLTARDFVFQNPDQRQEQWRAQIINAHPKAGEPTTYGTERDSDTRVLISDYSLITIMPGVVPGRYIADLGGLDTKGTQGATMFVTSAPGIEQLTRALGSDNVPLSGGPPIFQALIRVRLAKGYQVLGAELTSLHPMPAAGSSHPATRCVAARH